MSYESGTRMRVLTHPGGPDLASKSLIQLCSKPNQLNQPIQLIQLYPTDQKLLSLQIKQAIHKLMLVKHEQVLHLLTNTDEFHWNLELIRDS